MIPRLTSLSLGDEKSYSYTGLIIDFVAKSCYGKIYFSLKSKLLVIRSLDFVKNHFFSVTDN